MKSFLAILFLLISLTLSAQGTNADEIRRQMAKVRQSTNWSDPAAAKKATEEIRRLAAKLSGNQDLPIIGSSEKSTTAGKQTDIKSAVNPTKENILRIADRFFNRGYKQLNAIEKNRFDLEYQNAQKNKFNKQAIKTLTSNGANLMMFGTNHHEGCVYLASAVKADISDTLAVNNFGAYLRIIDSLKVSLPVLLFANTLFDKSPVILTQIGCSYFELKDFKKGETYLKLALQYNPGFGKAHSALCELYLKTGRWKDALQELIAGVVNQGCSYMQAHANFNQLADVSSSAGGGGSGRVQGLYNQNNSSDGDNALAPLVPPDNGKVQIDPQDMLASLTPSSESDIPDNEKLASLVPEDNKIKMPQFSNITSVNDWMEGGGYSGAITAFRDFLTADIAAAYELQQVLKEQPNLPPDAVLRDYPNERFAIDCIVEMIAKMSNKESMEFSDKMDKYLKQAVNYQQIYLDKYQRISKEYVSCLQACPPENPMNEYCTSECRRKYCLDMCNAANSYNQNLQNIFDDCTRDFNESKDRQEKMLDDLYGFTTPWFKKLYSPYWSRIEANEIRRVALLIVGNTITDYAHRALTFPAHTDCGSDCSLFVNPAPPPVEEVENKNPEGNECPFEGNKLSLGIGFCSVDFDCESIEAGCSAGVSISAKRNFKNKSSTLFVGAGGEANLGAVSGEIKTGVTFTKYDNGNMDVGGKFEMTGKVGAVGKNYEMSATLMEGANIEGKNVIGF